MRWSVSFKDRSTSFWCRGFVSRCEIPAEEPDLVHFRTSQKKRLKIGQSRARSTINCRFDSAWSDSATKPQLRARTAWLEANYRLSCGRSG
jgi:hypothetical protein